MRSGDLLQLSDQGRCLLDEGGAIGLDARAEPWHAMDRRNLQPGAPPIETVGKVGLQDVCLLLVIDGSHALVLAGGKLGWIGSHLVEVVQ
jgi:hypothetical protein